jgi:hypothetical protein
MTEIVIGNDWLADIVPSATAGGNTRVCLTGLSVAESVASLDTSIVSQARIPTSCSSLSFT